MDNGNEFWCDRCEQNDRPPVPMYKLDIEAKDPTGTLNLTIFGEQAQRLVGVAAKDLVEEVTDENRCTVPAAISRVCGSTHVFEVIIKESGFVVKWIPDEDELALLEHSGSNKMTVGCDGPLPKEECYSSAPSCSWKLTGDKMVIVKRETELKTEDEALEADAE